MNDRRTGIIAFAGLSIFCLLIAIIGKDYVWGIIGMFAAFFCGMGIGLYKPE